MKGHSTHNTPNMVFGFGKSSAVEAQDPAYSEKRHGSILDHRAVASGSDKGSPINDITEVEANQELRFLKKQHKWDPNLPDEVRRGMDNAVETHDKAGEVELVNLLENDSPYPEVRAAVRNYDEEMPANTIRAWVLGMLLTTIGSALNMLFSLRNPYIVITAFVAQLVAYPLGVAWEKVMPSRTFRTFGKSWSFNPGPFNMKEHTLIVIMANVTFGNSGAAYSTDTIVAQKGFYGQDFGWGFQLLLTLGTQMIGYGLAGFLRKYLVWPASMIW